MGRSKDNTEGKKRKGYEENQVWLKIYWKIYYFMLTQNYIT